MFFLVLAAVLIAAEVTGHLIQTGSGRVDVSNVTYPNVNGIPVRAKLFRPNGEPGDLFPGIVYVHGYQNNRETGDAYCIELSRRGFVVLNIDALGRGNSGNPGRETDPGFDQSYGVKTSVEYIRSLPFVDSMRVGLAGHSLGAEMVYRVALEDPGIRALVLTGAAYTEEGDFERPKNMLMIIGEYDEFRKRMTGTRDIETEWMASPATKRVIDDPAPRLSVTYGDFGDGTARRVIVPPITHVAESHDRDAIAETLRWMRASLEPDPRHWIDEGRQVWQVKEGSTLAAMLSGIWILIPLSGLLMKIPPFRSIVRAYRFEYAASGRDYRRAVVLNGALMWLYLPLILVLFAVHLYVVPIDRAFPFMMVNGIVWWFLLVNTAGILLFARWMKRKAREGNAPDPADLGISYKKGVLALEWEPFLTSVLLGIVLFLSALVIETLLERVFIIDYRFIFPFASDLTWGRAFISWSVSNILVMVIPIALFLCIQYVPLFTAGIIPLVGPGAVFIPFILDLFHLIGVLVVIIPRSTWLYLATGKIYAGSVLCAAVVTWMFVSSQVIAPIPV